MTAGSHCQALFKFPKMSLFSSFCRRFLEHISTSELQVVVVGRGTISTSLTCQLLSEVVSKEIQKGEKLISSL